MGECGAGREGIEGEGGPELGCSVSCKGGGSAGRLFPGLTGVIIRNTAVRL